MDIILLKKVGGLGNLGDKVTVRPGYGRNYLIPTGTAVPATADNLKAFEERRAELEAQALAALAEAEQRKARLEGLTVAIARKAGDEGRLFGSVGTADIAEAITEAGVPVEKSEVRLPAGPFRAIGEHAVELHLHSDVDITVQIEVVPAD
ncbi:50S ribosomal protein L9 [Thiohalocapsa marina]|uniref:Large ribosomal subunit protein bL9 n=1 Tax=Thiohalocapsa marina TaxID=424902 RepID=A0A5M8FK42_9GAMM|nr:50S ribosomal protein L9 [Thiohalocapsa marina]KAA6182825.1 50S ribosomal protein L9 [Thiohalocapsa marina]